MRVAPLLAVLVAVALSAGCIENMQDLKRTLGFDASPPPPDPAAPTAKAQANATTLPVGIAFRFTSEGTKDPKGLSLLYSWDLGDGTKSDAPSVTHAYATPGERRVTLTVTNSEGLADSDVVTVQAVAVNRAPVASFAVSGTPDRGSTLTFDPSATTDPDGDALTYAWDFGDGTTSTDARPTHAYAAPGLFTVKLTATDAKGLAGSTTQVLAVNATWEGKGRFDVTSPTTSTLEIVVVQGATLVEATLRFDAGLGANDVEVVLRDAGGAEVARSNADTAPATQGMVTRVATADEGALATAAPGKWTVEVVRETSSPAGVEWTLTVRVTVRQP